MKVSLDELYLAWRQAKSTLFFERRGVGLDKLATFEDRLEPNLRKLQKTLSQGSGWFDGMPLGEVWVTPKRLKSTAAVQKVLSINHIGTIDTARANELEVQLRCNPSPQFATVEVLFLWRFGPMLQSLLSDEVVGYRLDHGEKGSDWSQRRWLFEYWPPTYSEFRSRPLAAAREILDGGQDALILTADFASFYDTVHADFLESILPNASVRREFGVNKVDYLSAVASLLRAHEAYRRKARLLTGIEWPRGIPIGPLTSRLIANLALQPLDKRLSNGSRTTCYRRYVDDLLLVGPARDETDVLDVMKRFFGKIIGYDKDRETFTFAMEKLGRSSSQFEFQSRKIRAHRLSGRPGRTFLDAVENDLESIVSERRAFPDPDAVASELEKRLIRAESREGSKLRVFRDADRARLEKYALNTTIQSLERISVLVDRYDAELLVKKSITQIRPLLEDHGDWVTELEPLFRLLKVAATTSDYQSAKKLTTRLRKLCGPSSSPIGYAERLLFREQDVSTNPARTSLREYLLRRMEEAVISAVTADSADRIARATRALLGLTANKLIRRAKKLTAADLRMFDREDDRSSGFATRKVQAAFGPRQRSTLTPRVRNDRRVRERPPGQGPVETPVLPTFPFDSPAILF